MVNLNTPESLSATTRRILEHLRYLPAAPGVTIGGGAETAPRDPMVDIDVDDDDNPDERESHRARDARIRPTNDYGPIPGDIPHRDIEVETSTLPQTSSGTPGKNAVPGSAADGSDANYLEKTLNSVQSEGCVVRAGELDGGTPTAIIQEKHMESESGTTGTVDGVSHSVQYGGTADCIVKMAEDDSMSVLARGLASSDVQVAHGVVENVSVPGLTTAQSPTIVSATSLDENHAIPLSTDATESTNEICKDSLEALPATSSEIMDIDQHSVPTTKDGAEEVKVDSINTDTEAAKERAPELMELDDACADLQTAAVSTASIPVPTSDLPAEAVSITPPGL
mmetsp:Transcript_50180/g.104701  ORF Transcript_50180/g.104701 Transcript_50180/m.104701 type:complete len:339 (-) Transcript_50180:667-1683(-)